jgi:ABC-type dipeptide/oligopeptide/nickel transport system permease component
MNLAYVGRRSLYVLLNLWIIVTLVFFMFRALPGNPADVLISPFAPPELRLRQIELLGLDRPLPVQYLSFLGDVIRGQFGVSFYRNVPVTDVIGPAFINTMVLVMATFLVSYFIGAGGGALLAWTRGSLGEKIVNAIALVMRGAPTFWVGMLLIMIFSVRLGWFPSGGMRGGDFGQSGFGLYFSVEFLRYLALPVLAASTYALGLPLLLMRNTMLDVVDADYIDLARAKGLSKPVILYKHALRNALMPMIAESSQFIGWAVGGLVVIEFVFSWPGLGREIVNAVSARDYPLAQGAFLLIAVLVMLLYFFSDLIATYLDPRTRRV